MLSKTEAGYRAPDHRCPCLVCRRFDAYLGACSVVEGIVRPMLPATTGVPSRTRPPTGVDLSDEARKRLAGGPNGGTERVANRSTRDRRGSGMPPQ